MTDQFSTQPPQVLTRRTFLRIAGGTTLLAGFGGVLAACGGGSSSVSGGGEATTAGATGASGGAASAGTVGGPFNIYTWGGYEGGGVKAMDTWYSDNGVQLNAKAITTPGTIPTLLQGPGGDQWDASSANQGDSQYYHALGISSEITVDEVPGLATMLPFFGEGSFWKVRDGVYNSVPWTWGPIAFMARTDRIPEGSVKSWLDLTMPEYKGRLETFDDPLNMIATGAVATGLDPGKVTRDQLNGPIKDYLAKLVPNLKIYATSIGDQVNNLVSGDVDGSLVGYTWGVLEGTKQGADMYFSVPKEGAFGFCDAVFIPPSSKHRANAIAYSNALLSGDTAAAMQEALFQMSTNQDVIAKASPKLRAFYPEDLNAYTDTTLKWNRSYYDPNGDYATIQEWTDVWNNVKAGA